jgi:DNA-binding Lrp family transcriptional regulator
MQEQILAALKKLGPSSPGQIADHLGTDGTKLGYHFKALLEAGTIKATGSTSTRRLALPDQDLATALPAQPRERTKRRKAKHAKRPRRAKSPSARPAARAPRERPAPAERFIPAVDKDARLIIVNGGEPHIYSEAQTEAIASLLFQHYNDKG